MKVIVRVFRVFLDKHGKFGNPVGIIVDEKHELQPEIRQKIAAKVGFSETVIVDNITSGSIQLFNPKKEVAFAGHALVGTAYFITKILGQYINSLTCKGGVVESWGKDGLVWIRAGLLGTPPWHHKQLENVEAIEGAFPKEYPEHSMIWAWIDQSKGLIRARTFAPDWGIPEDQANGSGSMQLAAMLKQKIEVRHGKGSVIYASFVKEGVADVGGKVKEDRSQEIVI